MFSMNFQRGWTPHYEGVYFRDQWAQTWHMGQTCLLMCPNTLHPHPELLGPQKLGLFAGYIWCLSCLVCGEGVHKQAWVASHASDGRHGCCPQLGSSSWACPPISVWVWKGVLLLPLELRTQPSRSVGVRGREWTTRVVPCPSVWIVIGSDWPSWNRSSWNSPLLDGVYKEPACAVTMLDRCWLAKTLVSITALCPLCARSRQCQMLGQSSSCSQTWSVWCLCLFAEKGMSGVEGSYCRSCSTCILFHNIHWWLVIMF